MTPERLHRSSTPATGRAWLRAALGATLLTLACHTAASPSAPLHGSAPAAGSPRAPALQARLELLGPAEVALAPQAAQELAFELRLNRALPRPVTVHWVLEPAPASDEAATLPARRRAGPWPQGTLTMPAFSTRLPFTVPLERADERGTVALQLRLHRLQGPAVMARSFHSLALRDARETLPPAVAAQAAKAREQLPVFEQLLDYLGAQRRLLELMAEGQPPSAATQAQLRSIDQLSTQLRQARLDAEMGRRPPLSEAELKRLTDTLIATLGPRP